MENQNSRSSKKKAKANEEGRKMRRLVFYHLVSTEDKAEYLTENPNGISEFEKMVGRLRGLEPQENYIDDFDNGTVAKQKPDFQRMIRDAHAGKFDLIFANDIFSFSTDVVEAVHYCRLLKAMNIEVFFSKMGFRTFENIAEPLLEKMKNFALTHDYMGRVAEDVKKERGFRK